MIRKLDNTVYENSKLIWKVFQLSYSVEARILNAENFPPLKRSIESIQESNNIFFISEIEDIVNGVIEIHEELESIHIQSLVVLPSEFRKGGASKMLDFILDLYKKNKITVETGVDNLPAVNLYLRFKFNEIFQWDTDHGVRKIRFELIN